METLDLNNLDTTDVELNQLISDKTAELKCVKSDVAPNNAKTGQNWNMLWITTGTATSTTGKDVPAGHNINLTISLTPTPKYAKEKILQRIAEMMVGVLGAQGKFNPAEFVGQTAIARLKISKDKEGTYPDKNEIVGWVPQK